MEASCFSATDPDTGSTSSQSIIEATAIFTRQLQHEWKCQRTPKGLKKGLAEAYTLEETATERIFLDYGGTAAWLAFFRSTRFQGKRSQKPIALFHEQSAEDRINVAKRVAGIVQHPSVTDIIYKISHRRPHRRRVPLQVEAQQNPTASSATSPTCAAPPPNKTHHGFTASTNFTRSPPEETQSISTTNPAPPSNATQPSKLERALQQGIVDVFNKRICNAIKGDTIQENGTTYLKAAVTMSFPTWVMEDCIMTLAIHENKVEDLAKALFNVQVESRGQVRYLILPGGAKVAPSPELTVKGVPYCALLDVFGPEIYDAVMASNMREEEVADGFDVLQCVSMILPASSRDTVVINLTLETVRAVEISNKIFPKM